MQTKFRLGHQDGRRTEALWLQEQRGERNEAKSAIGKRGHIEVLTGSLVAPFELNSVLIAEQRLQSKVVENGATSCMVRRINP